jgi:hypothetical protein
MMGVNDLEKIKQLLLGSRMTVPAVITAATTAGGWRSAYLAFPFDDSVSVYDVLPEDSHVSADLLAYYSVQRCRSCRIWSTYSQLTDDDWAKFANNYYAQQGQLPVSIWKSESYSGHCRPCRQHLRVEALHACEASLSA